MCYSICVKNALKNWKVYLIAGALATVSIGVPFLILVITLNVDKATPFQYPLLLGALSALYLLVGFVWGDLHIVAWRRKNKKWDDELPPEIKDSAWLRRTPFYLAAALTFLVFISFEIIFWVTGGYPFL